jgi:hypothetical protein
MALVAMLALVALAGCARKSVEQVNWSPGAVPRPELIVVNDFATGHNDVTLDGAIGSRLMRAVKDKPASEEEVALAHAVARILTENLVKEISKHGFTAVAASAAPAGSAAPASRLSIEGQFLAIDQGNQLRRAVVGFGAGASEVRTWTQIYDTSAGQHRMVGDFHTSVKSSRKPGMGPMAGAGAAAGRAATSAVVSGGVGLATAAGQTVEADAKHTAEAIAEQLEKFFAAQGWIAQPRR